MKRPQEIFIKLSLELFVIFIGVYLASYVQKEQEISSNYQKEKRIYSALSKEISYFKQGADKVLLVIDKFYKDWKKDHQSGLKPIPFYYKFSGVDRPPNTIWQATIRSNAIDLIDIDLLYDLSKFYNDMESDLRLYNELKKFGQYQILPYTKNKNHFYPNGRLRDDYEDYIDQFKNFINVTERIVKKAEKLITILDKYEKQ